MPCLCGYCGGAVDSIIPVFTQLHRSGFNLEFETLYESVGQVVIDLWQRKAKTSCCFSNSTSFVLHLQQFKTTQVYRKGFHDSIVALKFLLNLSKGQQCCLFITKHFLPSKRCNEEFDTLAESFLWGLALF